MCSPPAAAWASPAATSSARLCSACAWASTPPSWVPSSHVSGGWVGGCGVAIIACGRPGRGWGWEAASSGGLQERPDVHTCCSAPHGTRPDPFPPCPCCAQCCSCGTGRVYGPIQCERQGLGQQEERYPACGGKQSPSLPWGDPHVWRPPPATSPAVQILTYLPNFFFGGLTAWIGQDILKVLQCKAAAGDPAPMGLQPRQPGPPCRRCWLLPTRPDPPPPLLHPTPRHRKMQRHWLCLVCKSVSPMDHGRLLATGPPAALTCAPAAPHPTPRHPTPPNTGLAVHSVQACQPSGVRATAGHLWAGAGAWPGGRHRGWNCAGSTALCLQVGLGWGRGGYYELTGSGGEVGGWCHRGSPTTSHPDPAPTRSPPTHPTPPAATQRSP